MKFALSLLLLGLTSSMHAHAWHQLEPKIDNIAITESDNDDNKFFLRAYSGDGKELLAFDYVKVTAPDPYGKTYFTVQEVMQPNGVEIVNAKGDVSAIRLKAPRLDIRSGGTVRLTYLVNYMKKTFADLDMEIQPLDGQKQLWALFSGGKRVKKLFIKVNRVPIIGKVGIAEIVPITD